MLLMIALLTFSQITMEISVYGFIVNRRNLEITNEIQSKIIEENNIVKTKSINEKVTKAKTDVGYKKQQSGFLLSKPIKGGITTSCFGDCIDRKGPHIGHDWAVDIGTKVKASEKGVVEKAYYSTSYGFNVVINHQNGIKTRYAHLSKIMVKSGQKVDKGKIIGLSGNSGQSTGPHLHFEVEKNGVRINPVIYLNKK